MAHEGTVNRVALRRRGQEAVLLTVDGPTTLGQLLTSQGLPDGLSVFLGESRACLATIDEEAFEANSADAPSLLTKTIVLRELGGPLVDLLAHQCTVVEVDVRYNGKDKRHRFAPNTTVGTTLIWARKAFKLTGDDNADLALEIRGSANQLPVDKYLGELVADRCDLSLDLVKGPRVQG